MSRYFQGSLLIILLFVQGLVVTQSIQDFNFQDDSTQKNSTVSSMSTQQPHIEPNQNPLNATFVDQDNRINNAFTWDLELDSEGNLVLVGWFDASIFFQGRQNGFISKMTSEGVVEWTYQQGGDDFYQILNVDIDSNDNIFATGYTDASNLVVNDDSFQHKARDWDSYTIGLTTEGDYYWSTYLGGFFKEFCGTVMVDSFDKVYTAGCTFSFNFPQVNPLYGTEFTDISYMTRFNNSGNLELSTYLLDENILNGLAEIDENNIALFFTNGLLVSINSINSSVYWGYLFQGEDLQGSTVVTDSKGDIYITGTTWSDNTFLLNPLDDSFNGSSDMYLAKFDKNGTILWSTYLGGAGEEYDQAPTIEFDENDNPILTATTNSLDFPVTDGSSIIEGTDVFVTKISSNGSKILSSSIFGGFGEDQDSAAPRLAYKDENEVFVTFNSFSDDIFYGNTNLTSLAVYEYDFGEDLRSVILNFDMKAEKVNWISRVNAIPQQHDDYDGDGLSNQLEYELCVKNQLSPLCIDPLNFDTDGDGINDGYEYRYNLQPTIPNAPDGDTDGDNVYDIDESQFETDPYSNDTDNDGMSDRDEIDHGLDPNIDDSLDDLDGDGLPNLFELQNGLNPADGSDALADPDLDGLNNLAEYNEGTNLLNNDTDGDEMDDYWEVENGLNATDDDAFEDYDRDGFRNIVEYRRGWDPGNPRELYIVIGFISGLLIAATFGIYWFRRSRKKREESARSEGWTSYEQKKSAFEAGFGSFSEYKTAKDQGFLRSVTQQTVQSSSYNNARQMKEDWELLKSENTIFIQSKKEDKVIDIINQAKSPESLLQAENSTYDFVSEIDAKTNKIDKVINLAIELLKIENRNIELFVEDINVRVFDDLTSFKHLKSKLLDIKTRVQNTISDKKDWLSPWNALLTLIQITEDGQPISLSEIVEVTNTTSEQAEELIISLLVENPELGSYDDVSKTYTKGINIQNYIKKALELTEKFLNEEDQ